MKKLTSVLHPWLDESKTGSIVPAIQLATVFGMTTPSSSSGFQYGRVGNPTRKVLEKSLATLFEAKHAFVFSSGVAAISMLLAILRSGDEVICHTEMYEGTARVLGVLKNFGIQHKCLDLRDLKKLEDAITDQTRIIFFETPTNPKLQILPIKEISNIAHQKKVLVVVDNTLASPVLQQPLTHGADVVVESLTKGVGGHSDVLAGMVAVNNTRLAKKIRNLQITFGATLSPFESFLLLRSMKTLFIRIEKQQQNADEIRKFLEMNSSIQEVFSPPKKSFNNQMKGRGFLVSFIVKGDERFGDTFIKQLKIITIGHSFGGAETLIQQPVTMMDMTLNQKKALGNNFFRLSIGLEDAEDIIKDLQQALLF